MGVDQGQWRNMLPTTRGDPLVELGGGNLRAYEARGIQPPQLEAALKTLKKWFC